MNMLRRTIHMIHGYSHSRSWSLHLPASRRDDILSGRTSRWFSPDGVFFTRSLSWANAHEDTWSWTLTVGVSRVGVSSRRGST